MQYALFTSVRRLRANVTAAKGSLASGLALSLIAIAVVHEATINRTMGVGLSFSTSLGAIASIFLIPFVRFRWFFDPGNLYRTAITLWPLGLLLVDYAYLSQYGLVEDNVGQGLRNVAYLAVIATWFHGGASLTQNRLPSEIYVPIFSIVLITATVSAIRFNQQADYGFAATKNDISGVLVHLIFLGAFLYILRRKETSITWVFLSAVVATLFVSILVSERALIPAAAVATLAYVLLRCIRQSVTSLTAVFVLMILGEIALVDFISGLSRMPGFDQINSLVIELTGRRLNSGREHVWSMINYYVSLNPWFGLGAGVQPSDVFESPVRSAHNSFLQVLIQTGIVGLSLLLMQMYLLWSRLSKIFDRAMAAAAMSYFIIVMFHASSESFLTNTNFPTASLVWLTFGILVSVSRSPEAIPTAVGQRVVSAKTSRAI
jgi:O-antigen ligase